MKKCIFLIMVAFVFLSSCEFGTPEGSLWVRPNLFLNYNYYPSRFYPYVKVVVINESPYRAEIRKDGVPIAVLNRPVIIRPAGTFPVWASVPYEANVQFVITAVFIDSYGNVISVESREFSFYGSLNQEQSISWEIGYSLRPRYY